MTLFISVAFDGVLLADLLQKLKSYGVLVRFLARFHHLFIRRLCVVLDGKPLHEYPIHTGVLQGVFPTMHQ